MTLTNGDAHHPTPHTPHPLIQPVQGGVSNESVNDDANGDFVSLLPFCLLPSAFCLLPSAFCLLARIRQSLTSFFQRSRSIWLMLLLSLLLSGCVRYDVGIRFDSPNRGEFVQHIQLEERLKRFNDGTAQQWLALIKKRTQRLGGRLERLPDDDLLVTIPFTSSGELQTKFNQFFSPLENDSPAVAAAIALPPIASRFTLDISNLLLVERNHLRYELDLRSLGVLSSDGSLLLSPASLINLEFRLSTPWGARSDTAALNQPKGQLSGKTLVWQLVPGALNQLDVVFWMPNALGLGALAIVLLVVVGRYLKYPGLTAVSGQRSAVSSTANADR